ncbi:MAG: N-acetyltransferase [Tabrizicola sp.]|nr:N-acetyltransferase [Tabrizicola sp.]
MVIGPDFVRSMRDEEAGEVDALLRAAFPGPEEAELVRALRTSGEMVAELVLPWEGRIGAHAGISRMVAPVNWFCLAPVAVWPEWQRGALRRGDGSRVHLGSELLSQMTADWSGLPIRDVLSQSGWLLGEEAVTLVVLGKPSFYARAGFSLVRAARVRSPYSVDHTLILRPGADVPEAELVYPMAFAGLG